MPFGAKRSFTESLSPPSQSSSSDDEPVDPPLKRRFLSSPQAASPNEPTADGPPIFTPYYTPQSSGVGLKRAADDLEVDDDDDSGSSTEGERDGSSPTTTTYVPNDAGHHGATAHHHRPPPVKRLRRGLASHLKRMGLDPADLGPSVEEQPSHAYTAAPWASAFPQQQPFQPPDVEPSSVVEPGEVGPAVWLGHSRSGIGDEVRFEELDDSDGSDLEAVKTKAWRLEVWKGAHGADDVHPTDSPPRGRERAEMHLPSYMSSSGPWAYNLAPPEDVWTNRERGLVLYNPASRPTPNLQITDGSSSPSSEMELDTPTAEQRPPGFGELNAGGWFSDDASRFEELPDDAAAVDASAEVEGGMDVD